jgi:hypothetical protein
MNIKNTRTRTKETILRFRILIEKQISRKKITYLAFIDIEKEIFVIKKN